MAQEQGRIYHNFDMTLEECRCALDTIDNMIIVDPQGKLKYDFHSGIPGGKGDA